jgi:hypothetical protein
VEGSVEIGEQQDGEVGIEAATHGFVQAQDAFAPELAPAALVGFGGISETIAEDDVAAVQGGRDDFGDALGAVGEHEAELGHGIEVLGFGVEEQAADAVADAGASRLAGNGDRKALGFKISGELAQLGGFAGAVEAFEGEEKAHKSSVQRRACSEQGAWARG